MKPHKAEEAEEADAEEEVEKVEEEEEEEEEEHPQTLLPHQPLQNPLLPPTLSAGLAGNKGTEPPSARIRP